jgi:hypothetical protein
MAGYESPRTTKLYDRTKDEITLSDPGRVVSQCHSGFSETTDRVGCLSHFRDDFGSDHEGARQRYDEALILYLRFGETPITRRAESQTARSELRNHSYGHAICFPGTGAGSLNIDNYFFKLRR